MRSQITENVLEEVNSNPIVLRLISKYEVRAIIASYMNGLSDDQMIQKFTTDDLAAELTFTIKTRIRSSNPPVGSDELEATLNRVDIDIRIGVANGICTVTVSKGQALDTGFGRVNNELKNLAN